MRDPSEAERVRQLGLQAAELIGRILAVADEASADTSLALQSLVLSVRATVADLADIEREAANSVADDVQ